MSGSLRYEWRRITSIRSTPILIACSVLVSVGMALLLHLLLSSTSEADQAAASSDPSADALFNGTLSGGVNFAAVNFISIVILSTIAAQSFGQEYRHGTIRLTLTSFPRRAQVFFSKIIMVVAFMIAAFIVAAIVSALILSVGGLFSADPNFFSFLGVLLRGLAFLIGYCLIAFAITLLTRILALGVVIPLVFAFVVEGILLQLLMGSASWLAKVMPMTVGERFMQGIDPVSSGLVFLAWVVGLLAIAYVSFIKRDA